MADKNFKGVSIRRELLEAVEEVVKHGRYRSSAEFVSEAIRLRLDQMQKEVAS